MDASETTRPTTFWGRQAARPSLPELTLYVLWLIAFAICASNAGMDLGHVVLLLFSAVALLAVLAARMALAVGRLAVRSDPKRSRAQWLAWLVIPAVAGLAFAVDTTSATFKLRVYLSRPALLAYAEDPHRNFDAGGPEKWAGLFKVKWVQQHLDGTTIFITGYGFFNPVGVLHCPEGGDPAGSDYETEHLFGPWYRYVEIWD